VCRPDEAPEYRLFGASTPGYAALRAQRERRGAAEEVRALYVALTRARRRVVVSGRFGWEAKPLALSETFADLLQHRRGGVPALAAEILAAEAEGRTELVRDGVRWRFPALEARTRADFALGAAVLPTPDVASEAEIAAQAARLARLGAAARARMERPRSRGAAPEKDSDEQGLAVRQGDASAGRRAGATHGLDRASALAIGTAVHAALEGLDLFGPLAEARARAQAALLGPLVDALGAARAAAAEREARGVLAAFFDGPLFELLRRLAPHVVARELPVLLAPDPLEMDGAGLPGSSGERLGDVLADPIGCWSGVVDLVYRDPASGRLVIADYKTDRVPAAEAAARAGAYRTQGRVYAHALQAALGLAAPPRFELWFLASGRIEPVGLEEPHAPA
jgi:ATP-dependent exoDNAse (exonuclease V) beta subunit